MENRIEKIVLTRDEPGWHAEAHLTTPTRNGVGTVSSFGLRTEAAVFAVENRARILIERGDADGK